MVAHLNYTDTPTTTNSCSMEQLRALLPKSLVSVYFRCATIDLSLIQQNLVCWISIRSMVAHLK